MPSTRYGTLIYRWKRKLLVVNCWLLVKTNADRIRISTSNSQLATSNCLSQLAASVYNLFPIIYGATLLDQ